MSCSLCTSSDQFPARSATHPAAPVASSRRASVFFRAALAYREACCLRVGREPLRALGFFRAVVLDLVAILRVYPVRRPPTAEVLPERFGEAVGRPPVELGAAVAQGEEQPVFERRGANRRVSVGSG